MTVNLLVVENEESQIKLLRDAIDVYNLAGGAQIILDEATTLEQGIEKLRANSYDGAIVDLRLEQNDKVGLGNGILREIKSRLRFPVRVISGHLGDLDPELQIESYLFKCINRGDEDYDNILLEFTDIFSTGITGILNNKGLIETNITNIFWKHISEVLPEFIAYKRDNPGWDGEKVMLRYISSHISEYLEISIDNNLEPAHNIEFYIKPPVKQKIFTGDVIKFRDSGEFGVVLTPACDLATDSKRIAPKADYLVVAAIEKYDSIVQGKSPGEVRKLKANSMDLKFHYLPNTILFEGGFINFQNLRSVEMKEADQSLKDLSVIFDIECVVTNPFRKDIISRFANYFSRQGQPSFN